MADDASASGWRAAAEAIMTTDTFPKLATATAAIDGVKVTINGIAKGSGMIAPDMATMLAFVFTDASAAGLGAAGMSERGRGTVLQFHHGGFGHLHQRHAASVRHRQRRQAWRGRQGIGQEAVGLPQELDALLLELALAVVKDGEGAEKLIRVDVSGRRESTRRRAGSRCPSPTRPWSRLRSPAMTPIGGAW